MPVRAEGFAVSGQTATLAHKGVLAGKVSMPGPTPHLARLGASGGVFCDAVGAGAVSRARAGPPNGFSLAWFLGPSLRALCVPFAATRGREGLAGLPGVFKRPLPLLF